MDLKDALSSVAGKSPLADIIIRRRFGNMVSEASADPSPYFLTEAERESVIDAIAHSQYNKRGDSAVRELTSVILHLLDELTHAHDASASESTELDDDEESARKMATFRESIVGARVGDLKCHYTESMFRTMKRPTRVLIAKELVEHAEAQGKEPARIWSVLVQNNGNL